MTQTLEILVGLPASGKSTYALEREETGLYKRVNWDRFRWHDDFGNPVDYKFNKQNEKSVKERALLFAERAAHAGYNLIADNTNLNESARKYWVDFAVKHSMVPRIVRIDTPLEECLRRNKLRTGWQRVPRAVIEWMALTNPYPDGMNRVPFPVGQETVIVDVDGTLADTSVREKYVTGHCNGCNGTGEHHLDTHLVCVVCNGARKVKKDWGRFFREVGNDTPNKAVAEWVKSLQHKYNVVIVSGRPVGQCGHATEDWLDKWAIPYNHLYMRPDTKEDDTVVKQRILDALKPHVKVAFAIDDRPRVLRMWQANGIKTYDVGNGVEF